MRHTEIEGRLFRRLLDSGTAAAQDQKAAQDRHDALHARIPTTATHPLLHINRG
jgi:hypothetical protein